MIVLKFIVSLAIFTSFHFDVGVRVSTFDSVHNSLNNFLLENLIISDLANWYMFMSFAVAQSIVVVTCLTNTNSYGVARTRTQNRMRETTKLSSTLNRIRQCQ